MALAIQPLLNLRRSHPWAVARIKDVPVWAFHGTADKIVPCQRSQERVDALRRAGGAVRFTRYPGISHNSRTTRYANPKLYAWFLQHQRR